MRKYLLFLLFLISFGSLHAQDILKMTLYENFFPDKVIQKNKIKHQYVWKYTENKKGGMDSTLSEVHNYLYNSDSLIVKEEYSGLGDIEALEKLSASRRAKRGFLGSKIKYSYNSQKQIIKLEEERYADGKLFKDYRKKEEFDYDSLGNLSLVADYYPLNPLFNISQQREYRQNALIKITRTQRDIKSYVSHILQYTADGDLEKFELIGPKDHNNYPFAYTLTFKADTITTPGFKTINVYRENRPYKRYQFYKGELCTEILKYKFEVPETDIVETVEKNFYNPDATLNTSLYYRDNKLVQTYRYFYTR